MSLVVSCRCGQRFAAAAHLAGQRVACPACGAPLQIPATGAPLTAHVPPLASPQPETNWHDILVTEALAPTVARPLPPTPVSGPARTRRESDFDVKLLIAAGCIVLAVVLVIGLVIFGLSKAPGLIPSVTDFGWQEHTSEEGEFTVLLPRGMLSQDLNQAQMLPRTNEKANAEGVHLADGTEVGVVYAESPFAAGRRDPIEDIYTNVRRNPSVKAYRWAQHGTYRVVEVDFRDGKINGSARMLIAKGRMYALVYATPDTRSPSRSDIDKFFASFHLLGEASPAQLAQQAGSTSAGSVNEPPGRSDSTSQTSDGPPLGPTFFSSAGKYSIEMPRLPEVQTQDVNSASGLIRTHLATVRDDECVYTAMFADFSRATSQLSDQELLEWYAQQTIRNFPDADDLAQSTQVVFYRRYPGREDRLEFRQGDRPMIHRVRTFAILGDIYQLSFAVAADSPQLDSADRFFASFRLSGGGASNPPSPSTPQIPLAGPASGRDFAGGTGVVVMQIRRYEGSLEMLTAVREKLRGIPWVDESQITLDEGTLTLTIGVRGNRVETGAAKAALETNGFEIGWTSYRGG